MNKIHRDKNYFIPAIIFGVAFITTLTIKLIFAWNPPTSGAPNPAGQTLYADSNSNIGIGVLSPGAKLEVFSTSSDSIIKLSRGPGSTTSTIFKIGTDSAFVIQNQSTNAFTIKNGNIGINTTNPNEKLTIDGSISVQELSSAPSTSAGYGKIYAKAGIGGNDTYTKLLLHKDGTNGSATFTDSSSSGKSVTANGDVKIKDGIGKTITPNGNAQISTAQAKFSGASTYFDGSGDYLSIPDSDDWDFNADFTIDTWINFNALPTTNAKIAGNSNDAANPVGWYLIKNAGNTGWQFDVATSPGFWAFQVTGSSAAISTGSWYHLAIVRSGTSVKMYLDGTEIGSSTSNFSVISSAALTIGGEPDYGKYVNAYLDEFRVSKGVARWTSNFTPPTSEYSTDSYTKLLIHANGANASTAFSDASVACKFSQCGYFDGSEDYLSIPDSEDFEFGSGAFTIDFWAYPTTSTGNHVVITKDNTGSFSPYVVSVYDGSWKLFLSSNCSDWDMPSNYVFGSVDVNQWQHIAVVRDGTTIMFFKNGVKYGSTITTSASLCNNTELLRIGKMNYTVTPTSYAGYLDEIRVSKGVARWTSNFTPPVGPYGAGGLFFKSSSGEEIQL